MSLIVRSINRNSLFVVGGYKHVNK